MKANAKQLTIVIKLGSSSICDETTHEPLLSNLSLIVETVVRLRRDGHRVVLVSSGAIAIGLRRLDIDKKPKHLPAIQAIAAVGQCRLIALWDELFKQLRQPVAQILLTRNDIVDRTQYLNAANTFSELLSMGVIPIVNENDTLAVSEIKFGDNDTLSAITAGMVHADYLFLMTDVDCLYDKNPRRDPNAKPIQVVEDISSLEADGSSVGTGGMATKLVAAKLATSAGVTTIITRSSIPSNIFNIVNYVQSLKDAKKSDSASSSRDSSPQRATINITSTDDPVSTSALPSATQLSSTPTAVSPARPPKSRQPTSTLLPKPVPAPPLHTRFLPQPRAIRGRHFWILHGLKPHGTLYIDQGAYAALTKRDKAGLLPVGVVHVEGPFAQQEAVRLVPVIRTETAPGYEVISEEVGRAIVNYGSVEILRIKGLKSSEIAGVLGYADTEYIAHRDNTAFFPKPGQDDSTGSHTPSI